MSGSEAQRIVAVKGLPPCPHGPDDAGHFIGQCNGGFVVTDTLLDIEGPAL